MLNVFRQHANNWFMVLIFALITFVFVFTFGSWGGGNVSGQMAVAATVNGHAISASQFRNQYQGAMRNMQMYQPGFTPEKAREQGLSAKVLDHLVDQELLAQAAEKRGLSIGDEELADLIHKQLERESASVSAPPASQAQVGACHTWTCAASCAHI